MESVVNFDGAELVTNWFGQWPSLHDWEVLSVNVDRGDKLHGPIVSVKVHAFQMTSEITDQGFYKLEKHCLIEFRFDEVDCLQLKNANHQNVIEDIFLTDAVAEDGTKRIAVHFESIYGLELDFECSKAQVAALTPFKPTSGVYA